MNPIVLEHAGFTAVVETRGAGLLDFSAVASVAAQRPLVPRAPHARWTVADLPIAAVDRDGHALVAALRDRSPIHARFALHAAGAIRVGTLRYELTGSGLAVELAPPRDASASVGPRAAAVRLGRGAWWRTLAEINAGTAHLTPCANDDDAALASPAGGPVRILLRGQP